MIRRAVWAVLFAIAALAAALPLSPVAIEHWYSRGVFPPLQRALTTISNAVPFALFDMLWIGATAALALITYRRVRADGWRRGAIRLAAVVACSAVAVYLAFLATWGLNYRRVPLPDKIAFDPARITAVAHAALGDRSVAALNAQYARAHAGPADLDSLRAAFQDAHRTLGGAPIVTGRPKQTLLGWYFHQASIAGMTDPFFLETLLAPDLLEVERPFVIAHEWAHLAGYADESEANFVAYLTCQRGDAAAQYSAALALIGYADPRTLALDPGPRLDIFAISYRYSRTNQTVRFAAR